MHSPDIKTESRIAIAYRQREASRLAIQRRVVGLEGEGANIEAKRRRKLTLSLRLARNGDQLLRIAEKAIGNPLRRRCWRGWRSQPETGRQ